jgi:hypothetical protein
MFDNGENREKLIELQQYASHLMCFPLLDVILYYNGA